MLRLTLTQAALLLALSAAPAIAGAAEACARPEVASSADATCPIKVGQKIPAVALRDLDGKAIDLRAEVAKKPALLVFYRGGWCPFCNTQLGQLQAATPELEKLGVQVLAVSVDQPEKLKATAKEHALTYRLLSDTHGDAIKAFGLAYQVDAPTLAALKGYKVDLDAYAGESHHLLPIPAAILVDSSGTVQFVYANPDYKVRAQPELVLAAAKLLKPAKSAAKP